MHLWRWRWVQLRRWRWVQLGRWRWVHLRRWRWVHLRFRAYLWGYLHWVCLRRQDRVWYLWREMFLRHRPCRRRGLRNLGDGSHRRLVHRPCRYALLHCWGWWWLAVLNGQRPRHDNRLRLSTVYRRKLSSVGARLQLILLLHRQRR